MNKKRFIVNLVKKSAYGASLFVSTSIATRLYLYQNKDPEIEEYVQKNIEQIIKEQESKLGMTYPKERPAIYYTLPEQYRFGGIVGLYYPEKDTIRLASGILIKPERDFSDVIATIATFNKTESAKRTVDHELAHFYCDKLKEKAFRNYSIFELYFLLLPEERMGQRLIDEGIAKYVENRMNGEIEEPLSFQDWPSDILQFTNKEIYRGGYTIVKPIIDQYGEKGIQFLLFNPPTPKELFAPKKYQERILVSIAKL